MRPAVAKWNVPTRVHEFDAREGIVPVSAYVGRSEKCGNDGSA